MSDERKAHCQFRRCYKMVTLLHTNRNQDFYFFVAVKVVPGNNHECPILYELVKQFVETLGKGVIKRLILDRGFLDGEAISICKKKHDLNAFRRRAFTSCVWDLAVKALPDSEETFAKGVSFARSIDETALPSNVLAQLFGLKLYASVLNVKVRTKKQMKQIIG